MPNLAFGAFSGSLGGEVSGLDLSKPLDDQTFAAIKTFWLERVVFVARGLHDLTPGQLVAFTRRFGEPHVFHVSRSTMPENPEVYVISNVVENGKPLGATGAGTWWHTDEMYLEKPAHRPPLSEDEKGALPDVVHPLVRVHPETGRRALFCGGGEAAWSIVGLPLF